MEKSNQKTFGWVAVQIERRGIVLTYCRMFHILNMPGWGLTGLY